LVRELAGFPVGDSNPTRGFRLKAHHVLPPAFAATTPAARAKPLRDRKDRREIFLRGHRDFARKVDSKLEPTRFAETTSA
jgi:hypothetical protein